MTYGEKLIETPGVVLDNGTIIDEVFTGGVPAFIVWTDPKDIPEGISNWDILESYNDLVPVTDDLLTKQKILLPSGICEYGKEEKLFAELVEYVDKWAELDSDLAPLLVLSVMSMWLYEKVPVFPIICLRGGSDTGKTRLGNVLWQIAFRGMRADGVLSLSSLFRNTERWHGTLYINEGDIDESGRSEDSESKQKVKFYNARYERGGSVWRVDKNTLKPEVFDSFGPTILTSRKPFADDALESRLLVIPMRGLTRTDIPLNLPQEFYDKGQELRNKLELFRLRNLARFENENNLEFEGVSSRMNQILQPIATLSREHLPGLFLQVESLAMSLSERVVEDRANSLDGMLVRAYFASDPDLKGVTSKQVSEKMKDEFNVDQNPTKVGRRARTLGFTAERSLDKSRSRLLKLEPDYAKRMKSKYLPKDEREETEMGLQEKVSKAMELVDQAHPLEEIRQIVGPVVFRHCQERGIIPKLGGSP